ncbi:MAG: sialate O-acetylesterase, partial [Planctomycetota bacterium]|nr:sialate O-acetylesterase [Planctomycetota bacterium]
MNDCSKHISAFALFIFTLAVTQSSAAENNAKKLRIFILAGQSNTVGHANYITIPRLFADERPEVQKLAKLVFKKGKVITRATVDKQIATRIAKDKIRNDLRQKKIEGKEAIAAATKEINLRQPTYDSQTQAIKDAFQVSKTVYINSIADGNRKSGPLTVGFGGSGDKIGPELGFGMSMAQRMDGPILLIKTSWGGKSLHYNFRPPSAGPYELNEKEKASDRAAQIQKDTSLNYRLMVEQVQKVLGDLKSNHPNYDETAGYEISGFVWFQGFNDQFSDAFRDNYKDNMIHFIKDVRKEFKSPEMKFVIGVLGTGMTKDKVDANAVSVAQRAAAKHAEFRGNVTSVESYQVYDL